MPTVSTPFKNLLGKDKPLKFYIAIPVFLKYRISGAGAPTCTLKKHKKNQFLKCTLKSLRTAPANLPPLVYKLFSADPWVRAGKFSHSVVWHTLCPHPVSLNQTDMVPAFLEL